MCLVRKQNHFACCHGFFPCNQSRCSLYPSSKCVGIAAAHLILNFAAALSLVLRSPLKTINHTNVPSTAFLYRSAYLKTDLFFFFFFATPHGMWDLSSLNRDQVRAPCIGRQSLNHWTAREVPKNPSWLLPLSRSSKTKSLIWTLLEVLWKDGLQSQTGTCFGQNNVVKVTRPWCACALSLRHLPPPQEQAQVRLLQDQMPCGEEPSHCSWGHDQPSRGQRVTNCRCTREPCRE